MASRVNKKFIIVVSGFTVAAIVLLVGAGLVYSKYVKDPERHILAGDKLMEEGKVREAYEKYGRAVSRKPDELRYIEKMEAALEKAVATTTQQAGEDYGHWMQLKNQRTRAQPEDPKQWQIFLAALEDEAEIYRKGEGWRRIETTAKEMQEAVPAGTPGADMAQVYQAIARAHLDSQLSDQERAANIKLLDELVKKYPGDGRLWQGLFDMQLAGAERAGRAGQANVATDRMKQVDATVAAMQTALAPSSPKGASTAARMRLMRLMVDGATVRRLSPNKVDPLALTAAADEIYKTALASNDGESIRESADFLAGINQGSRALDLLEEWLAKNPQDIRSRAMVIMRRGQKAASDVAELPALRAAAKEMMSQPQLPTSLNSQLQENLKTTALGMLLNAELMRINNGMTAEQRTEAIKELEKVREDLLVAAQNDATSAVMLSADAKLAYVKNDLPESQKKWEAFFAKVPAPTADAYFWALLTARARNENGLALQYAQKGTSEYPDDLMLTIQQAELSMILGRNIEAEALLGRLLEAMPENKDIQAALVRVKALNQSQRGETTEQDEIAREIDAALKGKDFVKARSLVDQYKQKHGDSARVQMVLARVALLEGNRAAAQEIVDKGIERFPRDMELWRIRAELMTEDPVERVAIMVKGVIEEPTKAAAELLNAFRAMRADLSNQYQARLGPDPTGAAVIKKRIDDLNVRIAKAEQDAQTIAANDPSVIESSFYEAIGAYQGALAENRQSDAQTAMAKAVAQLEAARKIASAPELPIVLESVLLELQGKIPDALALVEKARTAGRTESRVAVRLAGLLERMGREPESFEIWKDAYGRRPNDAATVLGYARALSRQGKGTQALEMLRQATDSNPADSRLPLTLAQYETLYGSRARAVQTREDLLRRLQPIPENISGLYSLLYMPPSFDAIVDTDGKPMLATRWNQLNGEQRGRFLSDTSRAMQARAEEVYKAALEANPLDIGLAVQKARVMREQGNIDEGTRAIQGVIDAAKARGKVPAGMYLDLGIHLLGGNRVALAEAAFAEARKLQDPQKREADLTLVEIEVQRGRVKEAAAALEDYAKTNPRVEVWARLSELLLSDSQFDQAQAALDKAKAMAGATPSIPYQTSFEMLAAGIAAGRAEAADRAGNLPEGKRLREIAAAGLLKAEGLQPNSLTPPLRRIGVLRAAAKAGGRLDPELYALAVAEADKLVARNAAIYEAAAIRANLAIDHGDKLAAIGVLERFLVAQPLDDAARARLIQLHLETNNLAKAVQVCRAASELAPSRADWRERLGDLLAVSGDPTGAGDAYERAFLVQPEIFMLLAKSMDERTRAGKPELALTMQQNAGPNAQSDPAVRAAQAVALMKQNKSAEAQAVAREAITTARAAGIHSPAMQQVLPRLRSMYPPDRTQELVDLILSTGAPNASEKVLIASMWGDLGKANGDLVLKWADDALAEGESVPAALRATALTARGNALYVKGDIPGAIKAFQAAADLEPRNATALNNAAYIAAEAGVDLDRSRTYAERAVAIAPETGEFLDTLGYVLTIQGAKAQDAKLLEFAEGVLQRALLMSESPVILLHLGDVQAALGRTLDARKSYERAKKAAEDAKTKDADLIKKIEDAMKALK